MDTSRETEMCEVQWENHFEELSAALNHFAHCSILTNVTLLSEKDSIPLHHVILSCFTTYYEQLIKGWNMQYLIHTQQDKFVLQALVDCIYRGVISVPNDYRQHLLTAAASMKIEGFSMFGNIENGESETTFRWLGHQQLLSLKIWESRQNSSKCDVVFIVNNEHQTYAHTCILAACSPFLLQMFTTHNSERSRPYVVALHNVSKLDLELVIEYCYKGFIEIPLENVLAVYKVADLLGMQNLCNRLALSYPVLLAKPLKCETMNSISIIQTSAIPTALSDLFKHERLVDIFLYAGGKLFKAHSVILSMYSTFFQKLAKYLDYDLRGVFVLIKNFEINVEAFLDYMYTGKAKFEGNVDEFCESMSGWLDFSMLPVSSRPSEIQNKEEELRTLITNTIETQIELSPDQDKSDIRKFGAHEAEKLASDAPCKSNSAECANKEEISEDIKDKTQEMRRRESSSEGENFSEVKEKVKKLDKSRDFEYCRSKSDTSDIDDPESITVEENSSEHNISRRSQEKSEQSRELVCETCKEVFNSQLLFEEHLQIHPKDKIFQCTFCRVEFGKPDLFQQHLRTHMGLKPYKCNVCEMNFSGKCSMKKHMKTHRLDKSKNYVCDVCKKIFSRKEYLEEHKRTHTGIKPFKCEECDKCFVGKTGLNHHKKTHMNNDEKKNVVCEVCGKNFTRHALWTHMKHHKKEHHCEYCNKTFATLAALNVHANRAHLGQFWHRCEKCGKGFMRKNHLDRHRRTHEDGESTRSFACSECPSKFKEKSKLNTHFKYKHTPLSEQTFPCSICPKRFRNQSSAIFHKKLHFSEHPHRCNLCGKTFGRPYQLRDHTQTQHSDEKPYECPVCKKKCSTPSLLKKHLLIHKPCPTPKPQEPGSFKCSSCTKIFTSKLALSNHSRTHSYSRPFECSVCRKAFHHQENLMKHLRQKHSTVTANDGIAKELPCIYTIQVCRPSFSQISRETVAHEEYVQDGDLIPNDSVNSSNVISQNITVSSAVCLNAAERSTGDLNLLQLKPVEGSFVTQTSADETVIISDYVLASPADKSSGNSHTMPRRPYSITIDGNLCCNNILSTDGDIALIQERSDLDIQDVSACVSVPSQQLLHVTSAGNTVELGSMHSGNNSDFSVSLSKEFSL